MGFTHSQGGTNQNGASTLTVTLGAAPATGDVVCVAIASNTSAALSAVSVKDANSNVYTVTPNSPSTFLSGAGQIYLFYLIAPSNAAAAVTATFTGTAGGYWVEDFAVSGGTAHFDKDVPAEVGSGSNPNTPTITPTNGAGALLFSAMTFGGTGSAPVSGGTLSGWTGPNAVVDNNLDEYQLSSGSGSTAVAYTGSGPGWSGMVASFYISAGASTVFEDDTFNGGLSQALLQPVEPTISVW